jgi:hypothetical protein
MGLYYVVLDANDSIKTKYAIPSGFKGKKFVLAVEAENDEAAHALLQDSFSPLARDKNLGEVFTATRTKHGWTMVLPPDE